MLHIIQSNDIELLTTHLLRHCAGHAVNDVFQLERIGVPSIGMARHLSQRFADARGIAAQLEFEFVAQAVWRIFAQVLPDVPAQSPFDSETTTLRLFTELAALPDDADHQALRHWLARQGSRGRMELAARLSGLFQQYLAFRPDWLDAWAQHRAVPASLGLNQPSERWQARLWRRLLALEPVAGPRHPKDAVLAELARRQAAGENPAAVLPAQIRILGVPSLPPMYLDVLQQLAQYTEVTLWFLNPCRQYWADLQSPRVLAWRAARDGTPMPDPEHALLASWGRQSREQFARFAALDGVEGIDDIRVFVDRLAPDMAASAPLLARLQQSILDLQPLQGGLIEGDDSIQLNSLHSRSRQLQALHDALLGWFADDPTLTPADVLVLLPDLDAAAADIDAVFSAVPADRYIPFAISGRREPAGGPYFSAWKQLLKLLRSRMLAAEVLDFVALPPVARALSLGEDELGRLRHWLDAAGVRWGRDAAQRAALQLDDGDDRHSWASGLRRLLLGYAAPTQGLALVAGELPVAGPDGADTVVLGRLLSLLAPLFRAAAAADREQPIVQWCEDLAALARHCLLADPTERAQAQRLQQALQAIADASQRAACEESVPLTVIEELLERELNRGGPGGVATGRLSFCGFGPLRGLPWRIVCMLDLGSDDFPHDPAGLEFDLMRQAPRAGDRSRRDEDRGAFLDALLGARDRVWLAWSGRSARDNSVQPPSVVVAELLDYLAEQTAQPVEAVRAQLLREHPLQPFNAELFAADAPQSFASEQLAAARRLRQPLAARAQPRPLFAPGHRLPPAEPHWRDVDLEQLIRFYRHPPRFLLRERLGIELRPDSDSAASAEPFVLDRDGRRQLRQRALQQLRADYPPALRAELLARAPELPHGAVGAWLRTIEDAEVAQLQARAGAQWQQRLAAPPTVVLKLDGDSGPFRLTATLRDLGPQGLLLIDVADYGFSAQLEAWLRHLLLCAAAPDGVELHTRLISDQQDWRLAPVTDAHAQLSRLLDGWWQGLHQALPFARRSAGAWLDTADAAQRHAKALAKWQDRGRSEAPGESCDPWWQLLYGGVRDTLPDGFADTVDGLFSALGAQLRNAPTELP